MRVYYISSGLQGCYFYRCLTPLTANGWDGDQTTLIVDNAMKTPEDKAHASQQSDVVVFHRPDTPEKDKLGDLLRKTSKKIVFDNDDTYKDDGGFKFNEFLDKERLDKNLKTMNASMDAFIKKSDMVTTSTEFLADEYRKLNDNVVVLPNYIDPFWFDEPKRNEGDEVRIGITGSIGVTSDFDEAMKIVEETLHDKRIKWVLFSMPRNREDKFIRELYHEEYKILDRIAPHIEWHGFVDMELYYDYLNELKLDMMIIPRADNYFNRCKSNVKFLEASMFEIPVIAQGFKDGLSPYQVNPEDAKHMIIANDTQDFLNGIEKLVKDKELRVTMGKKAKEYVVKNYNIEDNAYKWEDAYKSLFNR